MFTARVRRLHIRDIRSRLAAVVLVDEEEPGFSILPSLERNFVEDPTGVELPDNTTAASLAIGVAGTGSLKAFKTTPLLTAEEGLAAMQAAGQLDYQPPG